MAYAFNDDRSKAPVYQNVVLDFNKATSSGSPNWDYTFDYLTYRDIMEALEAGCNVFAMWKQEDQETDDYHVHTSHCVHYDKGVTDGAFSFVVWFEENSFCDNIEIGLNSPFTQADLDALLDSHPVMHIDLS